MPEQVEPPRRLNHLLAGVPIEEYVTIEPYLQIVQLTPGMVLHQAGECPRYVYFPESVIVGALYTNAQGANTTMAIVGNDGVVGISVLLEGDHLPYPEVVHVGGSALRISAQRFQQAYERCESLRRSLHRYAQALMTQVAQNGACHRLHTLEQRMARVLLACQDGIGGSDLNLTQELIAPMVGSWRESVSVVAGALQDHGLIRYTRGHIRILDRPRLESTACECYDVVRAETRRLVGLPLLPASLHHSNHRSFIHPP